jgi:hypothetical protein
MLPFRRFCLGLALLSTTLSAVDALEQLYCSSQNTGSDYSVGEHRGKRTSRTHNLYDSQSLTFSKLMAFALTTAGRTTLLPWSSSSSVGARTTSLPSSLMSPNATRIVLDIPLSSVAMMDRASSATSH